MWPVCDIEAVTRGFLWKWGQENGNNQKQFVPPIWRTVRFVSNDVAIQCECCGLGRLGRNIRWWPTIKMSGYWVQGPLCVFEVHKSAKTLKDNYILSELVWSIKVLVYGPYKICSWGTKREITTVENTSCPLAELALVQCQKGHHTFYTKLPSNCLILLSFW